MPTTPTTPTVPATRAAARSGSADRRRRPARMARLALPVALVAGLAFTACGSDDDAAKASTPTVPGKVTTTTAAPAADEVEVHAIDFAFTGLPEKVDAGTRIRFVNDAETEVHELVAIRLPDDEKRSVDELIELPEEEGEKLMGGGPPALVVIAAPGGEEILAVGDGVLEEPGRYLLMCSVPEGSDASIIDDGPPQDSDMPPHFAHGMYAELIVE